MRTEVILGIDLALGGGLAGHERQNIIVTSSLVIPCNRLVKLRSDDCDGVVGIVTYLPPVLSSPVGLRKCVIGNLPLNII